MRTRILWLLVALTGVAILASCHLTPAGGAAWAAAGTAAVDAGASKLVESGVWDTNTASLFSGWAHLLSDTLANATGLTAKLQAVQEAHAAQLAAVSAKIPTQSDLLLQSAGTAVTTLGAVQAVRGRATPAHVKALPPAVI